MENLREIVGYVCCASLVGAASYALGCLMYYTNKNSKERKKEENKKTKISYFPNR